MHATHDTTDGATATDGPFEGTLRDLSDLGETRDEISIKSVVETLEARGFGPLLLVLSALMLLPTGMVPGFPAVVGLVLVICGAEMIRGKSGLWIPGPLSRITFSSDRLDRSLRKARPWVNKIRTVLGGRMQWAVTGTTARVIAAVLILLGGAMAGLGFVPGLPFLLALPVLLFGVGLTAGDGLAVVAGFVMLAPALGLGASGL